MGHRIASRVFRSFRSFWRHCRGPLSCGCTYIIPRAEVYKYRARPPGPTGGRPRDQPKDKPLQSPLQHQISFNIPHSNFLLPAAHFWAFLLSQPPTYRPIHPTLLLVVPVYRPIGREAQSQVVAIHFQSQSSAADNRRAQSQAGSCTFATSFWSYTTVSSIKVPVARSGCESLTLRNGVL